MKVLKGQLKETLYSWPNPELGKGPEIIRETVYPENGVTYMSDNLGLHKVSNPDPDNLAVSLHCKSLISSKARLMRAFCSVYPA